MTIPAHLQQALDDARRRAAVGVDDARARMRAVQSRSAPTLPTPPTLPTLPTLPLPTGPLAEQAQTLREARRRRQARTVVVVVVVLAVLVFLLRDCGCAGPSPTAPSPEAVALVCPEVPECGPAPKKNKPVPKRPSVPRQAKTAPQSRDVLGVAQLRAPPWLQALRLQVTARSLALAACFNGTEKPGALRMSAMATPSSGVLADPVVEPLVGGPVLSGQQRVCVTRVLTDPPYRLPTDGVADADIGTRISLVLEF
jgi:hypothetical protein